MLTDQITAQIRQLLTALGTLLGVLGYAKTAGNVNVLLTYLGPGMIIFSSAWSIYANMKASIVKAARAIPEVRGVVTVNTEKGRALADAIPGTDVAVAGTPNAKAIAK